MFQARILIRRSMPGHAIRRDAHRCRNACRTRRDGLQRMRVVVVVERVRRNALKNALQECDLAPVAREADVRSRVAMQGEYRCVRIHLVRVVHRGDKRAETMGGNRSTYRPAS